MSLVNFTKLLDPAFEQGYAVGAFNVINSIFADAILDAAERKKSPIIFCIAEAHLKYLKLEQTALYLRSLASQSRIPIALNLDHGKSFDTINRAVRSGFTSITFDGSTLPYEENVKQTQEVVKLCRAAGTSVEAELGALCGSSESRLKGEADSAPFTNPDQAEDFVSRTGIDALGVAIGNMHGRYKPAPQLDFDRLRAIRRRVGIPLVLHGGSGISEVDFRRVIQLGIAKINVFASMAQAAIAVTKMRLKRMGEGYHDFPDLLGDVGRSIGAVVEEYIEMFGSTGRTN